MNENSAPIFIPMRWNFLLFDNTLCAVYHTLKSNKRSRYLKVTVKKEGVLVDFIYFIKQIKLKNKKDDYFKDNISM